MKMTIRVPTLNNAVKCEEDGTDLTEMDTVVVTAKKKKYDNMALKLTGDEQFFSVTASGITGYKPAHKYSYENADKYEAPKEALDVYNSGGIPGHTHPGPSFPGAKDGVEPGPGPDDGLAAVNGIAYMISPVGAFRITRGTNGYAVTKLTKGGWGANTADIAELITNWNKYAGKSTASGVAGKGGTPCKQIY